MRILYLCHRIPYPPNKGEKIRAFHQIKALAARHEVDVFTLADDPGDLAHRDKLAQYCRRLTVTRVHPRLARLKALPFLLTGTPMTLPYFHSPELAAAVRNALRTEKYDRIVVYCSAMAQYVEAAGTVPVVMDFVDVDSEKWIQYAGFSRFPLSAVYRREGRCLREYERKAAEKAEGVVVSTEREAELLRQIAPAARIRAIPNGVDTAYFDPAAVPCGRTSPGVVFTGDMGYFPNQDAAVFFARKVLPLIRHSLPETRFCIVGRNPNQEVLKLKEIEGVEVTGFVPDVRTYLAQAHVAVAPFSMAAGIQNKILEAMAFELPVVTTPRAAQGLIPAVAEVVEIGATAGELAARVTGLLRQPERAHSTGVKGRQRVAEHYSWKRFAESMSGLLEAGPGKSRTGERAALPGQ